MKKFILKIILLISPIGLYVLTILLINPFNYFKAPNLISKEIQRKSIMNSSKTMTYGNMLWNILDFKRHPKSNIIIGDSRAYHIDTSLIKELIHEDYYNLSVHGLSIDEMSKLFWFADSLIQLKNVYLAINFNTYSKTYQRDLYTYSEFNLSHPSSFLTNRFVITQAYLNLKKSISQYFGLYRSGKFLPDASKKRQKMTDSYKLISRNLAYWKYSELYFYKLKSISNYCLNNKINLSFIIFPNYMSYQHIIDSLGLFESYAEFLKQINSLGPLYDFNISSDITNDQRIFNDLLHTNDSVYNIITREIFMKQAKHGDFYKKNEIMNGI